MKTKLIPLVMALALQGVFHMTVAPAAFADVSMDAGPSDGGDNSSSTPASGTGDASPTCDPNAEYSRC